ncbi:MAG: hypothetical protein ACO3IV_03995 [Ilumatobacteraceae bacterium]
MQRVSRRSFLRTTAVSAVGIGVSAGMASVLGACGTDASNLDGNPDGNIDGELPEGIQVIQRFPQILVPGDVRMPISLALGGGLLTTGATAAPSVLTGRLERLDGADFVPYVDNLRAERHDVNLATPYWPFRATIDAPGVYQLLLDGGPVEGAAIQVSPPDSIGVPQVGQALPPLDSPTVLDPRGVSPLCTRTPQACSLHEVSLRDAVALGKPIVYLVGTPAHCSTGTCAPALDALLDLHRELGDEATFIHAEVYADQGATTPSPAITDFAMTYEPALFITDATGVVVDRLDAVFDVRELRASLARAGVS